MANLLLTVLLPILVLLLLFICVIFALGRRAHARLVTRFPPPGTLGDVGGHRLHINAAGDSTLSSPTVIMEAGRGEASLTWAAVQPEVAKFARVCSYDRAGLGWSEQSKNPRTISQIVEDLHSLLRVSGEKPPFVLVGHSIGGLYVRLYAQKYPEDVVGLVLVDPTHEDQMLDASLWIHILDFINYIVMIGSVRFLQLLNIIGLLALLADGCKIGCPLPTTAEAREMYASVFYRDNKHMGAAADEIKTTNKQLAEARAAGRVSLGDVPLVVLSASPFPIPHGCWSCFAGFVKHYNAQRSELLKELVALSQQGRLVVARESGHHVQVDNPRLVTDAIRDLLSARLGQL